MSCIGLVRQITAVQTAGGDSRELLSVQEAGLNIPDADYRSARSEAAPSQTDGKRQLSKQPAPPSESATLKADIGRAVVSAAHLRTERAKSATVPRQIHTGRRLMPGGADRNIAEL